MKILLLGLALLSSSAFAREGFIAPTPVSEMASRFNCTGGQSGTLIVTYHNVLVPCSTTRECTKKTNSNKEVVRFSTDVEVIEGKYPESK